MNDILTVSGLNKSYGDFSLKDVTFSLPEGCITGFIGVNGAGKTTTLRTLLGLTNKLSGKIQFFGLDMDKNEREIKDRIGIVLDGGGFYEELSLGEMKVIISSAYTSWSEQDFKRYMDMFSLDPKQKINCRATHSGLHKRHIIISNFSKKKAQSHLNDTIMPLFLHFISSMPGC